MLFEVVITAVLVTAFVGGATSGSRRPMKRLPQTSPSVDDQIAAFLKLNLADPGCEECKAWLSAQRAAISARQAADELRLLVDAVSRELLHVLAGIAALVGMALTALLIPLVGAVVASGFYAAAAILTAQSAYLMGQLAALQRNFQTALTNIATTQLKEEEALWRVLANCGPAAAEECRSKAADLQSALSGDLRRNALR